MKIFSHKHIISPNSSEILLAPSRMMLLTLLDTRYIGVAGKIILAPIKKGYADRGKVTSWPGAKTKL